ncbi:MAG: gluconate 2-dehydrogenase subunit 3 family protein [Sediminicola sp.]|tara:strand:- start:64962 stop:65678 length:717 start_codon:yes stop_codon:yes gene_type:complete
MDRRKSIKSILLGSVAGGLVLHGCGPDADTKTGTTVPEMDENHFGRTPQEKEALAKMHAEQFFNEYEMDTMKVLCALILPANEKFGSATDAGVPDFIEFMSKDIPELQTPLRGGLMWLDHASNKDFGTVFTKATAEQQKQLLDTVAFPDITIPLVQQPLPFQFFSLMRNLTLTGYYTSKMGIEDLGYKGNSPNVWDGVPEDVLQQHGVSYDPAWLAKCVDQSKRADLAEWDAEGNLIT